jgi:hypothetical protein
MLSYLSHLLQPLDVVCFLVLERAYSYEIEALIRYYTNDITKLRFLLAFKVAFKRLYILANICLAF